MTKSLMKNINRHFIIGILSELMRGWGQPALLTTRLGTARATNYAAGDSPATNYAAGDSPATNYAAGDSPRY